MNPVCGHLDMKAALVPQSLSRLRAVLDLAGNLCTGRHTVGDIGVIVRTPRLRCITVRSIGGCSGDVLVELGEADAPTGSAACSGIARFEHVDQRQLAIVVVDRFQLEVQLIDTPRESQAAGRIEDQDRAGRCPGVGVVGAPPGRGSIFTAEGNQCASSSGSVTAAQTRSIARG